MTLQCPVCREPVATAEPRQSAAGFAFSVRCQNKHCPGRPLLRFEVNERGLAVLKSLDRAPARIAS